MQIQKISGNQNFGLQLSPYLQDLLDKDLNSYKNIAENSSSHKKQVYMKEYERYKGCVNIIKNVQPDEYTLDVLKTWEPNNYNYDVYLNTAKQQEHIGRLNVSERDNTKHSFNIGHLLEILDMLPKSGCFLPEDYKE